MGYDPKDHGALCSQCFLCLRRDGPPVPPEMHSGANVLLVGEAPGGDEIEELRPFVGPAGQELSKALGTFGYRRSEVSITNSLLCRPPGNRLAEIYAKLRVTNKERKAHDLEPLPSPIECCRPRLFRELSQFENIVLLGKTAVQAVLDDNRSMFSLRGGFIEGWFDEDLGFLREESLRTTSSRAVRIFPTIHPSLVLHERRWTRTFRIDIGRAMSWFKGESDWVEPSRIIQPTVAQIKEHFQRWISSRAVVAHDFETEVKDALEAKIFCLGIGTADTVLVIPWISKERMGQEYYSPSQRQEILYLLKWFFTHPDVTHVGWNSKIFDAVVMKSQWGFQPLKHRCLMTFHRSVEPELFHNLYQVGSTFVPIPGAWKADNAGTEAKSDRELYVYNCLMAGTPVVLADGSTKTIEWLVRHRYGGEVLSTDDSGRIVKRRVIGWSRARRAGQKWVAVKTSATRPRERGLVVTPDHNIWTPRGWVEAQKLRPGDLVQIPEPAMEPWQRQALLGTFLGDSSLVASPCNRARMHEAEHLALAGGHAVSSGLSEAKVAVMPDLLALGQIVPGGVRIINGKKTTVDASQKFGTSMLHQMAWFAPLLYDRDGTRRLRIEALELLGAPGFAWWFMDDGCIQKKLKETHRETITLVACRYPAQDVQQAAAWLTDHFGLVHAYEDKVFRFSVEATNKFCEYIAPHVFPLARYKMPDEKYPEYRLPEPAPARAWAEVRSAEEFTPQRGCREYDLKAETRFCIEIEDTHRFFTPFGLVKNSYDCAITARLAPPLKDAVLLREQSNVVMKDHRALDLCAGMHEIGILVDPKKRDEYDHQFLKEFYRYREICRQACGVMSFNPNSYPQVSDILFDRWGLPPLRTSEKTGDPSTDDDTLREFRLNQPLRKEQKLFIEALRRCRLYSKLRGTEVVRFRKPGEKLPDDPHWTRDDIGEHANMEELADDLEERGKKDAKKEVYLLDDGRVHSSWNQLTTCVTPDTWVLTNGGPRQIGQLRGWGPPGSDLPASSLVLHDGESLRSVSRQVNPGEDQVLQARTLLGFTIAGPGHHRIQAAEAPTFWGGRAKMEPIEPRVIWKRLDELRAGDYLRVVLGPDVWAEVPPKLPTISTQPPRTCSNRITLPSTVTRDLAYFAGVYNADGSLHDGNGSFGIRITCRVHRCRLPPIEACMVRLFGREAVTVDTDGVRVQSVSLGPWVEVVGLLRRLEAKRTPWWILASPREFVEEYLRGLALDSSVNLSGPGTSPQWKFSNGKEIVHEVRMLLCNMGIVTSLKSKATKERPSSWELLAHGMEAEKICKITGQILPERLRTGDFPRPKYTRRGDTLWLRVEEISTLGAQPVLDVTVPGTHRFWSNGFISHNSGRFNSTDPALQNRKASYRDMFIAEPYCPHCKESHVFVGADMDQLELRYGAAWWGLQRYLQALREGRDPHEDTLLTFFGNEAKIAKAAAIEWAKTSGKPAKKHPDFRRMRDFAKTFYYAAQFAAEPPTVHNVITSTENDKGELVYASLTHAVTLERYELFMKLNPELEKGWQRDLQFFRKNGYTREIIWGRRRDCLNGEELSLIVNHPVQSGGRAIVLECAFRLVDEIPFQKWCPKSGLVHDGHDALTVECPASKAEWVRDVMTRCMTYDANKHGLDMQFTAEAHIGKNMLEIK